MKSIALLLTLLLATNALAATRIKDLTTILGTGTSNNVLLQANVGTANNPTIRFNPTTSKWEKSDNGTSFQSLGSGDTAGIELMSDPSFESGISEITGTSATATSENTILRAGPNNLKSAVISYSGSTGKACVTKSTSSQFTGGSGWVQCDIRSTVSGTTDSVFRSYVDGVLQQSQAVDTRGVWQTFQIPITFGSTSAGFCIEHTSSDTSNHYIDKCSISAGDPTKSVAQPQLIGSAYIQGTTSCQWTRTNTAIGAFATVAACPGPTSVYAGPYGAVQTTDTDLPRFTWNNLPPGVYTVEAEVPVNNGAAATSAIAISDGTTTSKPRISTENNGTTQGVTVTAVFEYTSAGNRSWEIYGAQSSGAIRINNNTTSPDNGLRITVRYNPPADKIYTQPNNQDSDWVSCGLTTSDFVGFGTVSSIQDQCKKDGADLLMRVKFTAGTTTATEARVGLKFQGTTLTSQSSTYIPSIQHVGTMFPNDTGTASTFFTLIEPSVTYVTFGLRSGTTAPLSKINGNAITSSLVLNLIARVPIATWTKSQLTGTFREVMTTPGVSRPKTCYYAFGGASATLASPTVCSSGTCTEVYDSCNSATPPTRSAAGAYGAVTFASGTWANNSPVFCTCQAYNTSSGFSYVCQQSFVTGQQSWSANSSGGYVSTVTTFIPPSTFTDLYVQLKCEGQAP